MQLINPLQQPQWQTPPNIQTAFSTRMGGVSDSPHHSFNLSATVGDDEGAVGENRMRLREIAPAAPRWLQQAHSARVVLADEVLADETVGDASYTFSRDIVCAVTTADCLPVLLCAKDGSGVAAVHAGWRGLAEGIIENAAAALREKTADLPLLAWIGPAICRKHYEVGDDVYQSLYRDKRDAAHFDSLGNGKWHADLSALAAARMQDINITTTCSNLCTYGDSQRFFSARRENKTGRQAVMIWIQ